ncbi:MAG: tetratricopeptide repeat protein, partial [Synechococcaceae bacterium WB7_1B_046]|nr:tetratricopeptide repeat protein [Synechococcaceae bacterium WB7_1B_046]
HYQAALKLYPRDPATLRDYGRLLLQQNKIESAEDVLAKAVRADSSDPKAQALYAVTLDYAGASTAAVVLTSTTTVYPAANATTPGIIISAEDVGTWSNNLYVKAERSSLGAKYFNLNKLLESKPACR